MTARDELCDMSKFRVRVWLTPEHPNDLKLLKKNAKVRIFVLLHIMCGHQCDKAATKNNTREVI